MKSFLLFPILIVFISRPEALFGYTVSKLTATYKDGQVYLTWKCPLATNLKYKVYRSSTPFTSISQLNTTTFLGAVRDSSSKNIRQSRLYQSNLWFKINDDASPLTSEKGLYVVTCSANQSWYYAVMVVDLSINKEGKKINAGKNTLTVPVIESIAEPQPVWQDSTHWGLTDEYAQEYAIWGDNQNLPHYPCFNNVGSYGYNFNLVKRGSAQKYPLYIFYEGLKNNAITGNGLEAFDDVTNCYILCLDDWIPEPTGGFDSDAGRTTSWVGHHENYDIYSSDNSVPTTGRIITYTQHRLLQTIKWARKNLPVDTTQVYLVGVSTGGFGVILSAQIAPELFSAVYSIVSPVRIKAQGGGSDEEIWGASNSHLKTDVLHPETGDSIEQWDLMNTKYMMRANHIRGLPFMIGVHGKNDVTVGWSDKPGFYDSTEVNLQGGNWYWDQRVHDGDGALFFDDETMPDFSLFRTNRSYPAFSNCSVNRNPGNGTATNGDPYGCINGYLTWEFDNITDNDCEYEFHPELTEFFAGGLLDLLQYTSCTTDITLRRVQNFKPAIGDLIKWSNFNSSNTKIQNGSFTYSGGPLTLKGITVKKSGNRIHLDIYGCSRISENEVNSDADIKIIHTMNGYTISVLLNSPDHLTIKLFNISGHLIQSSDQEMIEGINQIHMPAFQSGIYFLQLESNTIRTTKKLAF